MPWKTKVINISNHCKVWLLPGANVFKLLMIFRDTTNWPHCQEHLAVITGSRKSDCKFRKHCTIFRNVPPSYLQICHGHVAGVRSEFNYPLLCILWCTKTLETTLSKERASLSHEGKNFITDSTCHCQVGNTILHWAFIIFFNFTEILKIVFLTPLMLIKIISAIACVRWINRVKKRCYLRALTSWRVRFAL